MVYNLVLNAVKQALQLRSLDKMTDNDFNEVMETVSFLQRQELSKKDAEVLNELLQQVSDELDRRCYPQTVVVLYGIDAKLIEDIRGMSERDRLALLNRVLRRQEKASGQPVPEKQREALKELILAL
jgi:hypothetical protein